MDFPFPTEATDFSLLIKVQSGSGFHSRSRVLFLLCKEQEYEADTLGVHLVQSYETLAKYTSTFLF